MSDVIVIKKEEHLPIVSPFCKNGFVVSDSNHSKNFDMAIFNNIKPTIGHYHNNFEEAYLLFKGSITVETYNPTTKEKHIYILKSNDLIIIPPKIHHKITASSEENCLYVICVPGFNRDDEFESQVL